jgi:hypothetical protein
MKTGWSESSRILKAWLRHEHILWVYLSNIPVAIASIFERYVYVYITQQDAPHKDKIRYIVGFEVFTSVAVRNAAFWDVAPCRFIRRFGRT